MKSSFSEKGYQLPWGVIEVNEFTVWLKTMINFMP